VWHTCRLGETCTGFWWESPKEKDHGVNGIKMGLSKIGCGGVEWIHLAQDRDC
jgi:hypothetical protein